VRAPFFETQCTLASIGLSTHIFTVHNHVHESNKRLWQWDRYLVSQNVFVVITTVCSVWESNATTKLNLSRFSKKIPKSFV